MREGLGGDIRKREREEVTVKLGAKQFKLRSGRKQKERQTQRKKAWETQKTQRIINTEI